MKVYRTNGDGIAIWKISGVLQRRDVFTLIDAIRGSGDRINGYNILDFENVEHAYYLAFRLLEESSNGGQRMLFSGLSDYLLDIYAFARQKSTISIFSDCEKAFRYARDEYVKGSPLATAALIGEG